KRECRLVVVCSRCGGVPPFRSVSGGAGGRPRVCSSSYAETKGLGALTVSKRDPSSAALLLISCVLCADDRTPPGRCHCRLPIGDLKNGRGFFTHVGFGMMFATIEQIPALLVG